MSTRLTPAQIDEVLSLQLTVAWAGELAGEPKRLGWWKTDLVDREGGGDLFARLVPKTAIWASLALVREAAIGADQMARENLARQDHVWTLFHLGFAADEQLQDRLEFHRNRQHVPGEVLGARYLVGSEWSKSSLESMLKGLGKVTTQVTPTGRKLEASAKSASDVAPLLAAALLPLGDEYSLPYWEVPL